MSDETTPVVPVPVPGPTPTAPAPGTYVPQPVPQAPQPGTTQNPIRQQPPQTDQDDAKRVARLHVLKDLGFDDEDAYNAHKANLKKEADAKLSAHERSEKALKDALDSRGHAEAKIKEHQADAKAAREELRLERLLNTHGVVGKEDDRGIVAHLLSNARGADKGLDEAKFLEALKTERPYLFGAGTPALANASPRAATPAAPGASAVANSQGDALNWTPQQVQSYLDGWSSRGHGNS